MATIEFHKVSEDERKLMLRRIDETLGEGVGNQMTRDFEIVVASGKRAEVFLVSHSVMDVFFKTQGKRNPYCLGLYIGDLLENRFLPSIEGATLCSPYTTRKVKVSYKGEQAVLYGRHLKLALITDFPSTTRKGEKVLVTNTFGETIAIGKSLVDGSEFPTLPKERVVVENILDRGWYLRKGT